MANESKKMGLQKFLAVCAGVVGAGYLLGLGSFSVYEIWFKGISFRGFDMGILLLGMLAVAIYISMGVGIAFAYRKFVD